MPPSGMPNQVYSRFFGIAAIWQAIVKSMFSLKNCINSICESLNYRATSVSSTSTIPLIILFVADGPPFQLASMY